MTIVSNILRAAIRKSDEPLNVMFAAFPKGWGDPALYGRQSAVRNTRHRLIPAAAPDLYCELAIDLIVAPHHLDIIPQARRAANQLHVPLLAWFGAPDPSWTAPRLAHAKTFKADLAVFGSPEDMAAWRWQEQDGEAACIDVNDAAAWDQVMRDAASVPFVGKHI